MNRQNWLDLRIAATDLGWTTLLAGVACVSAALLQWTIRPDIDTQTEALKKAAFRERAVAETRPQTIGEERLKAFTNLLTTADTSSEALKRIFSEADKAGLVLAQADYQRLRDNAGGVSKLQITVPVKGSYPKVRAFMRSLLTALPALSIDEVGFRRETIKAQQVEARIKMTLHLQGQE